MEQDGKNGRFRILFSETYIQQDLASYHIIDNTQNELKIKFSSELMVLGSI